MKWEAKVGIGIQDFEKLRMKLTFFVDKTTSSGNGGSGKIILEFKVFDEEDEESTLEDTAANALKQIEEKQYEQELLFRGIPKEQILKCSFSFQGKECLIRKE